MKKKLTKTVLECIFSIALIFVPFIFANYFLTNYYLENGKFFWNLDTLLIVALEWLSVIIVSFVIRKKNKGVVSENLEQSKKVFVRGKANFIADLIYGQPCFQKHPFGIFNSFFIDPRYNGFSCIFLKHFRNLLS